VFDIINGRRRSGKDANDLLSMLLGARDEETGEAMSDEQLRDEVITLLIAGHETTAVTLSWAWYLLSENPEAAGKLRAELAEVLGGRAPTAEDLPNLPYTRMVVEESMRLYPPAWALAREAVKDDEIGGWRIPAGSKITLCQYVTHRDPKYWEEPEKFDPERVPPERSARRPRFAYFPFGGGGRICIGNNFAMMEAQLVLAAAAQRYRVKVVPGHKVEPDPTFTLRPRNGIRVTLERI